MPESKKSSASPDHAWVTILAGGIGSRFWPASTRDRPKQLLCLAGDRPLIVDTVERARALVPDERIRVLAGEHLARPFKTVVDGLPDSSYWIEPSARGTAPVLAWAAWRLARLDPEAVMVSVHADHVIRPLEAFRETVAVAVEVARRHDMLVTIGARPDRIETGYGHVEQGEALAVSGSTQACRVKAFHEKPDAETARRYVDAGYLWNTGIFVWKATVLLQEIARHAPELAQYLPLLEEGDAAFFDAVPVSVIDRAVMERSDRVATVHATFSWDDVGSWEALTRTGSPDEDGNVVIGAGRTLDASGSIVYVEGEGSVVVFGATDLIVVQCHGTTMVLPRARAPELKDLLTRLNAEAG